MRTSKELSIIVESTIKEINRNILATFGDERMEVISNICIKNNINRDHILLVGGYYFNPSKTNFN